ncbi:hypothetical protein K1719_006466 [Acacia pycnantha]|nr:hypothetical protein K1719_006466 [Acacia pycnantha]
MDMFPTSYQIISMSQRFLNTSSPLSPLCAVAPRYYRHRFFNIVSKLQNLQTISEEEEEEEDEDEDEEMMIMKYEVHQQIKLSDI